MSGHRFSGGENRSTAHNFSTPKDSALTHAGTQWARRVLILAATAMTAMPATANAQSFWGWGGDSGYSQRDVAPAPRRIAKPKKKNDPAEARAKLGAKPQGPLVIAVSISRQHVKVYDANGLFAESSVSTGTPSHPTPAGVFSIIQKNRHHVSNLYYAQMPYMQRITWSGVAMHTGALPGYAASHGCIRLPNEFAARLWTWTKMGTRVIVSHGEVSPADISHAKLIARMTPVQNVSAVPNTNSTAGLISTGKRDALAQIRTADATDTIAKMQGKLTDASSSSAGSDDKPASEKVGVISQAEPVNVGIDSAGDLPSQTTIPSPPETKSAEKPAEPETIAKPADIAKPAELAKPAETMLPAAPAEAAKPVVATKPRLNNHVAVFISRKDRKLYVRQGYEPIFDIPVEIADVDRPLGTHVFTARNQGEDAQALNWSVVSIPQSGRIATPKGGSRKQAKAAEVAQPPVLPTPSASEALDRIVIPADVQERIAAIIAPGGSILISDQGLGWETGRGTDFIVPIR